MSDNRLAQLVDVAALEASQGARARLTVVVPREWLASPCVLEIAAPQRLTCARCDGGGCDGCRRSGCLRAPDDAATRAIEASIPGTTTGGLALRLARPFGPASEIEQLILEVRPGERASPGLTRRLPPSATMGHAMPAIPWQPIALSLLALAGLLTALFSR